MAALEAAAPSIPSVPALCPNFSVICSFLDRYGAQLDLPELSYPQLERYLRESSSVPKLLVDLHVKLLRKIGKSVTAERWEKYLVKTCQELNTTWAWELEQKGYREMTMECKTGILKYLCECQFDENVKFKTAINDEDPDKMRLQPIGRDKDGQMYWFQQDQENNVRMYVEEQDDLDGSSWKCVVRDRNDLAEVVALLKTQIDPELLKRDQEKENEPEGDKDKSGEDDVKKKEDTSDEDSKDTKKTECPISPKTEPTVNANQGDSLKSEPKSSLNGVIEDKLKAGNHTAIKEEPMDVTDSRAGDACSLLKEQKCEEVKKTSTEELHQNTKNEEQAKIPLKKRGMKFSEGFDKFSSVASRHPPVSNLKELSKAEGAKKPLDVTEHVNGLLSEKELLKDGKEEPMAVDNSNKDKKETLEELKTSDPQIANESPPKKEETKTTSLQPVLQKPDKALISRKTEEEKEVTNKSEKVDFNKRVRLDNQISEKTCELAKEPAENTITSTNCNDKVTGKASTIPDDSKIERAVTSAKKGLMGAKEEDQTDKNSEGLKTTKEEGEKPNLCEQKPKILSTENLVDDKSSNGDMEDEVKLKDLPAEKSEEKPAEIKNKKSNGTGETKPLSMRKDDSPEEPKPQSMGKDLDLSEEPKPQSTKKDRDSFEKPKAPSTKKDIDSSEQPGPLSTRKDLDSPEKPKPLSTKKDIDSSEEPKPQTTKKDIDSPESPNPQSTKKDLDSSEQPNPQSTKKDLDSSEQPNPQSTKKELVSSEEPEPQSTNKDITSSEEPKPQSTGKDLDSSTDKRPTKNLTDLPTVENGKEEAIANGEETFAIDQQSFVKAVHVRRKNRTLAHRRKTFLQQEEQQGVIESESNTGMSLRRSPRISRPTAKAVDIQDRKLENVQSSPPQNKEDNKDEEEDEEEEVKAVQKKPRQNKSDQEGQTKPKGRKRRKTRWSNTRARRRKKDSDGEDCTESSEDEETEETEEEEEDDDSDEDYKVEHTRKRRNRHRERRSSASSTSSDDDLPPNDDPCKHCGLPNHPELILLCDSCDNGYHTACLRPPLMIIPDGEWFCPPCQHKQLCDKLEEQLLNLDAALKKRERAEKRKERLIYVGISLENIITPSVETEDKPEILIKEKKEVKKSKSWGRRSTRAKKTISYRFDEFDEAIEEAIEEDIKEAEGGGAGRGKDMANITGLRGKDMSAILQSEEGKENGPPPRPSTAPPRKKRRRLNDLDSDSTVDEEESEEEFRLSESSEEEFVGSENGSEAETDPDVNSDIGSDIGSRRRRSKARKSIFCRRSSRKRRRPKGYSDDEEEETDEDDEEEEIVTEGSSEFSDSDLDVSRRRSRRSKKLQVNYCETSESEGSQNDTNKRNKVKRRRLHHSSDSDASFSRDSEEEPRDRRTSRRADSSSEDSRNRRRRLALKRRRASEEDDSDNSDDSSEEDRPVRKRVNRIDSDDEEEEEEETKEVTEVKEAKEKKDEDSKVTETSPKNGQTRDAAAASTLGHTETPKSAAKDTDAPAQEEDEDDLLGVTDLVDYVCSNEQL
ncbi:remodeling and spacing factor 1 [Gouania willdenowi]|uniref:remodeling and spacing factor 1 n=1 Tax=Gouania willdenowi TaxID=441366 RepID=UPI0010546671|nr:remodeling and spacing factor 1-like [Gouania willdenowi]